MDDHTREIDGHTYEVHQLGFEKGRHCLTRLVRFLGPTLAATLRNVDGGLDIKTLNIDDLKLMVVTSLVSELSTSINDEDMDYFCKIFGDTSFVSNGEDPDTRIPLDLKKQESHFKGRYVTFFKWIKFCLEVNYSGFTTGLANITALAQAQKATPASA